MIFRERPAAGEPSGLLVLHHGRGADEQDLLPLGDALDPHRRLHVVTPRGPLRLPGSHGYHWYRVPRVGQGLQVFIGHGRRDPVIDVGFARAAVQRLHESGLQPVYRESEAAHQIEPTQIPLARGWLESTLAQAPPAPP